MCRKGGRIVLVGVVGLELNRADFYDKELTFQVSCSYGPGRYDPNYENLGIDYPIGYVRWTENRNFQAVLELIAQRAIRVEPLVTHRYSFDDVAKAYGLISSDEKTIGLMLDYPVEQKEELLQRSVVLNTEVHTTSHGVSPACAFIGAGNYASRVLIPAFAKAGVSARHHGEKNGFASATTVTDTVFANASINTVVVVTRHNSHAEHVISALESRKNVFVEKPLALTHDQLDHIESKYLAIPESVRPKLMVGFNRRFSPLIVKLKQLIANRAEPIAIIMTMNAGAIPVDSWVQDKSVGGGRIVGEACHYIDLMRFLVGSQVSNSAGFQFSSKKPGVIESDKAVMSLQFEDGSIGSIHYLANGGKIFPKERIEVFCGDAVLQLDNFKKLKGFGWEGFKSMRNGRQDKGQLACANAFLSSVRDGSECPIPFDEIMEVSRVTLDISSILESEKER